MLTHPEGLPASRRSSTRALQTSFARAAETLGIGPVVLDQLIDELPVGVLVIERSGNVIYANRAARELHGQGMNPVWWLVARAMLTGELVDEEVEVAARDKPKRVLAAKVIPERQADRSVACAVVTVIDVTACKRMEEWQPVVESLVNL
jgi:PAS domain-containing protein